MKKYKYIPNFLLPIFLMHFWITIHNNKLRVVLLCHTLTWWTSNFFAFFYTICYTSIPNVNCALVASKSEPFISMYAELRYTSLKQWQNAVDSPAKNSKKSRPKAASRSCLSRPYPSSRFCRAAAQPVRRCEGPASHLLVLK